jgi:hypothetical protein
MLDILDDYLGSTVTPELKEAIRHAHELFDKIGLDTYERDFEELLMTADEMDSHAAVDNVVQLTRAIQFKLLREHGVLINEDAVISRLNVYIDAILRIPDYDNPAAMFSILSLEHDPIEIAAEMFALVSGKTPEDLLPDMEAVDAQLFQLIVERIDTQEASDTEEVHAFKQARIAAYKHYLETCQITRLKLAHLLEHGMAVGHPVLVYLNLIGRDFDEMEAEPVAIELVAMCLISSDANENPRDAISKYLEYFISDLDKITKVTLIVNNLLLKVSRHG